MKEFIKKIEKIKDLKDFKEIEQLEKDFIKAKRRRRKTKEDEMLDRCGKYLATPSLLEFVQYVNKKDLYTYKDILKYELLKENNRVKDFTDL